MKKTSSIVTATILIGALAMTGCAGNAPAGSSSAAATSVAVSGSAVPTGQEIFQNRIIPVIVTNNDIIYTKDSKGYVLQSSYNTIKLDDQSEKSYPALSEALKAYSDKLLKQQEETVADVKKEPDLEKTVKDSGTYYVDTNVIRVNRADDDVFSLSSAKQYFLGGPHPNGEYSFLNLDPKTGKEIALTDVVKSKTEFLSLVKDRLKKQYPNVEFTDLDKSFKDYESGEAKLNWILSSVGISLYFNPYDLAPYAFGPQSISVHFDQYKDLFTGKYKTKESYVVPMEPGYPNYFDFNHNGEYDQIKVEANLDVENEHYDSLTVSCNNKSYKLDGKVFLSFDPKMIHTKDNKNYIYIFTSTYNDVGETLVFETKDGDVNYCGASEAEDISGFYELNGEDYMTQVSDTEVKNRTIAYPVIDPEYLVMMNRVDAMSTYHIYKLYKMNADGLPEASTDFGFALEQIDLTAKEDITAKTVEGADFRLKDDVTIKKGDKIRIFATNGKDTVIFKTADGTPVGLKYEDENKVNGKPIEDLFENLFFAG